MTAGKVIDKIEEREAFGVDGGSKLEQLKVERDHRRSKPLSQD